jgi:hypothetical protein
VLCLRLHLLFFCFQFWFDRHTYTYSYPQALKPFEIIDRCKKQNLWRLEWENMRTYACYEIITWITFPHSIVHNIIIKLLAFYCLWHHLFDRVHQGYLFYIFLFRSYLVFKHIHIHMIDDVSSNKEYIWIILIKIFLFSQFQIFFFILLIFNHILPLQSNRTNNNNCPHLFKTLSDCTCARPNTIDCSYSTTITHLPRSWRSTNHNLTSFTQSITRFNLYHTPSITLIKTDDFQVEFYFSKKNFFFRNLILGSL